MSSKSSTQKAPKPSSQPDPMSGVCGRRSFLWQSGFGVGGMALASLLARDGLLAETPHSEQSTSLDLRPRTSHHPPAARSVIVLMQTGAPSQIDLFDHKPELQKRDGQVHSVRFETFQPGSAENRLMKSPFRFRNYGESGIEMSELLPHIGSVADELCLVRSMFSENNNHPQGMRFLNTGSIFQGRPTLGAWIGYGLGSENQDLPAYVVLRDPDGYADGGISNWDNGWLPALFRGTEIQTRGAPILNLHPATQQSEKVRLINMELLTELNRERQRRYPWDSDLESRILNYELAGRMQLRADAILDMSEETPATRKLYGLDDPVTHSYGMRCLMARRLVERGVRFIHIMPPHKTGAGPWDHHSKLKEGLIERCSQTDLPSGALITDLRQRGLLESTIVVWAGEFGRLPISQNGTGRDHNRHAFSVLIAGGGFRAGTVYGETDEFGYAGVRNRVSCHDLHATILWQTGIDHTQLSFRHGGRDERLTDPEVTGATVQSDLLG